MAEIKLYREYRLKFYLNARHYIIIGGEKGEVHPHTWEYALNIKFGQDEFVQFSTFEKGIEKYLEKYQNRIVNEVEPFDSILPTLENMADYLAKDMHAIIESVGGILTRVEVSETPTRTYILNLEEVDEFSRITVGKSQDKVNQIFDAVIDEAIGSNEQ